jgi:ATP-dependent exoDNAse (exonuclease V) alpha subunit
VPDSNSAIMTKNLLYVGGTRAKKNHIYIGSPQAYINALKIDGVEMRNTWLLDLINN